MRSQLPPDDSVYEQFLRERCMVQHHNLNMMRVPLLVRNAWKVYLQGLPLLPLRGTGPLLLLLRLEGHGGRSAFPRNLGMFMAIITLWRSSGIPQGRKEDKRSEAHCLWHKRTSLALLVLFLTPLSLLVWISFPRFPQPPLSLTLREDSTVLGMSCCGSVRMGEYLSFRSSWHGQSHQLPLLPVHNTFGTPNYGFKKTLLAYHSMSKRNGKKHASGSWKPLEGAMSMN